MTRSDIIQIGRDEGLSGDTLVDFVVYIEDRGYTGTREYVREWAQRFYLGTEFGKSDFQGQSALIRLNPIKYAITA